MNSREVKRMNSSVVYKYAYVDKKGRIKIDTKRLLKDDSFKDLLKKIKHNK